MIPDNPLPRPSTTPPHAPTRSRGHGELGHRRGRRASPMIEALEERLALSSFTVTDTSDDPNDPGSLRYAIQQADAAKGALVIHFKLPTPATITLTNGPLELSNTEAPQIRIVGPGADQLALSGNNAGRIFVIDSGVTASISGLTITDGTGTGVFNQGTLSLTRVAISHNTTTNPGSIDPAGAGLYNSGTVYLVGCTLDHNLGSQGGGMTNFGTATLLDCSFIDNTATYYGGGMENYGAATLDRCTFTGNVAENNSGGGFDGINTGNPQPTSSVLFHCTFIGNAAPLNSGGAVALLGPNSGPDELVDCIIRDNTGGGLFLSDYTDVTVVGCLIEGNTSNLGGGVLVIDAEASFVDTTISSNTAISNDYYGGQGGGIISVGSVNLKNCTISNNSASLYGGGVDNGGTLTMTGCTISSNSAGSQGGGLSLSGNVTLTDCTISGNTATQGGGLLTYYRADVALIACTISGNSAAAAGDGGGLYNYPYGGYDPRVTLTDTIVAGNTAPDGPSDIAGADAGLVTGSYNLIGTGGSGGLLASDHNLLDVADPGLAPLGDYGGPTETIALRPNSPAIRAGTPVAGVTTDQRGFPLDNPVDIGAFQSQAGPRVVDTAIDGLGSPSGEHSLRQAVNLADVLDGGATITFDRSAFSGPTVIDLTAGPLELSNPTGPIKILGPGLDKLAISGAGAGRVFQVDKGASASLSGLTITGGDGGGLYNNGTAALVFCTVDDNATSSGGGVYASGGRWS